MAGKTAAGRASCRPGSCRPADADIFRKGGECKSRKVAFFQRKIDRALERTGTPSVEARCGWKIQRSDRRRTGHQRWNRQMARSQYPAKAGCGDSRPGDCPRPGTGNLIPIRTNSRRVSGFFCLTYPANLSFDRGQPKPLTLHCVQLEMRKGFACEHEIHKSIVDFGNGMFSNWRAGRRKPIRKKQ